jgi:hypothetical protein
MREQLTHACYSSKVINLAKQGKKDLPGKAAAGGVGGGRLVGCFLLLFRFFLFSTGIPSSLRLRMAASRVAEISAAASMEDYWMFTMWKSCWGWCSYGVKAKTMTMVMEGCPTATVFPSVFVFLCLP